MSTDDHDHDEDLDLELPADIDELARARSTVRTWLRERGVDELAAIDLLAVASEFLVHAIVRSGGTGSVRLVGESHVGGVRLAVKAAPTPVASGTGSVHHIGLPPDPLAAGALGRRLVEACCHELRIAPSNAGSDVELAQCWRPDRAG